MDVRHVSLQGTPNGRCGDPGCDDLGLRVPPDHEHRPYLGDVERARLEALDTLYEDTPEPAPGE